MVERLALLKDLFTMALIKGPIAQLNKEIERGNSKQI